MSKSIDVMSANFAIKLSIFGIYYSLILHLLTSINKIEKIESFNFSVVKEHGRRA